MTIESVERTMELHPPPERVWRAITDPSELSRWFAQQVDIEMRAAAEGWIGWGTEGRFHCIVDVAEPPGRLVWRWAGQQETAVSDDDSTTVDWTLSRRADGGTTLRLVESGFRRDEDRAANDQRWPDHLQRLFRYLDADAADHAGRDEDGPDDTAAGDGTPLTPANP